MYINPPKIFRLPLKVNTVHIPEQPRKWGIYKSTSGIIWELIEIHDSCLQATRRVNIFNDTKIDSTRYFVAAIDINNQ